MEEAKSSEHVPPAHLERSLEHILFASRWMLAPLYAGLGVVLLLVVFTFFEELWHAISDLRSATEAKLVVSALSLVDVVLLANLVLMVMLALQVLQVLWQLVHIYSSISSVCAIVFKLLFALN